jgi:hypothetical protein
MGIGIGKMLASGIVNAGSSALGGIGRKGREKRQQGYTKDLMGLQYANQRQLNKQGNELQMDMWNKTNYGAQMEHLKGAGLNPALMYGMSGGGGTTAGSQGGGSASSGSAPNVQETKIAGGSPMMGMMQKAQIDLMASQARNLDADTTNKGEGGIVRGKAGEEIAKLIAETGTEVEKKGLVQAQNALAKLQASNVKASTKKIGKEIEVAEQERALKQYEVELNRNGVQKTDNKIFRFLTKMASDNGYTLQDVIKEFLGTKDEKKPMKGLEIKN